MLPIEETDTTMTCLISKPELIHVVDEIFSSMAGMKLAPAPSPVRFDRQKAYVVSAVQIVGDWQGAVPWTAIWNFAAKSARTFSASSPATSPPTTFAMPRASWPTSPAAVSKP